MTFPRARQFRGTSVTWLARGGCPIPDISAITGHGLQSATQIIRHHLEPGEPLLVRPSASSKLVTWMERGGGELQEAVELATLEWVDRFNHRWLLEPIGNVPLAEAKAPYHAIPDEPAMAA